MTYLYVPDDDSEYGPIWEESEARQEFTAEELSEAKPAELVVMRDGSRGHYLAATYLEDAADILRANPGKAIDSDQVTDLVDNGFSREYAIAVVHESHLDDWSSVAAAYNDHQGLFSDGSCETASDYDPETQLCKDCEFIHETAAAAESVLSDLGYVTTWNNGFTIHKVEE